MTDPPIPKPLAETLAGSPFTVSEELTYDQAMDALDVVALAKAYKHGADEERAAIVAEIRRQGHVWESRGVTDLLVRYERLADSIERGVHHE